jgi:mono/diheme cytochrome c family protein
VIAYNPGVRPVHGKSEPLGEGEKMTRTFRHVSAFTVLTLLSASALVTQPRAAQQQPAPQQQPAGSTGYQTTFVGSEIFRTYCATCHGVGAKGDGPLAEMLKKRPADLTLFARNNNGVYPAELVGKIIDGRQPVPGHGGKDMPVWGDAFKGAAGGGDEASIKARIDALVEHLKTVQAK